MKTVEPLLYAVNVIWVVEDGTLLNEVKLWESAVHKRQNERVHKNVHLAEYNTFSSH